MLSKILRLLFIVLVLLSSVDGSYYSSGRRFSGGTRFSSGSRFGPISRVSRGTSRFSRGSRSTRGRRYAYGVNHGDFVYGYRGGSQKPRRH